MTKSAQNEKTTVKASEGENTREKERTERKVDKEAGCKDRVEESNKQEIMPQKEESSIASDKQSDGKKTVSPEESNHKRDERWVCISIRMCLFVFVPVCWRESKCSCV